MKKIDQLAEMFRKLPGIGSRQARRIVYQLLHERSDFRRALSDGITDLQESVLQCDSCMSFFENGSGTDEKLCAVCRDEDRNTSVLLLLQKDADIDAIESSGKYDGRYFVLGSLIPLSSDNSQLIRNMGQLLDKLKKEKITEVVIGLPLTTDGEHTRVHLTDFLLEKFSDLKISSFARGISTGTEIEYCDPETIENALRNRK